MMGTKASSLKIRMIPMAMSQMAPTSSQTFFGWVGSVIFASSMGGKVAQGPFSNKNAAICAA
jgi:hypothetical protein